MHNIPKRDEYWLYKTLKYLKEYIGFMDPGKDDILSLDKKLLLTFDDGYKSNRFIAEKILNELEIKAIFFITHDFIGLNDLSSHDFAQKNFFPQRKLNQLDGEIQSMTWDDVRFLKKKGHVIGAHTFTHPNLKNLPDDSKKYYEIVESADMIEEKIQSEIKYFAYPFGNHLSIDKSCINISKKRFLYSFTNTRGNPLKSSDNHLILRQNVPSRTNCFKLFITIAGILNRYYNRERYLLSSIQNS